MNKLRSKLARAMLAGHFTPWECSTIATLVEFHQGSKELPDAQAAATFVDLMKLSPLVADLAADQEPTLVYKDSGIPVRKGDKVKCDDGVLTVVFFRPPTSAASEGKITMQPVNSMLTREFYVSIVGAHWINRNIQRSS